MERRILAGGLALMALAGPATADTLDRTAALAANGTLRISSEGSTVEVLQGDRGVVAVHVESSGKIGEDVKVDLREESGEVVLEVRLPRRLALFSGRGPDTRVTVKVPREIALEVRTSGGDLKVSVPVTGNVTAESSGGDVAIGAVGGALAARVSGGSVKVGEVAGAAEVRSSGGDVSIGRVGKALRGSTSGGSLEFGEVAGAAELHSSGGDVHGGPIGGTVSLHSSGGGARLELGAGNGSGGDIENSGGDVVLKLDPGAPLDLDLQSSGGSLYTGFAVAVQGKLASDHIVGKLNGGGSLLRARSSGGSIRLEPREREPREREKERK